MINLTDIDNYRNRSEEITILFGSSGDSTWGCFTVPCSATGSSLSVMASSGEIGSGWDHVTVSTKHRTPNWLEMDFIKRMFFKDDETAMQLHVPPVEHICLVDNALHLWRPIHVEIPRPPNELVGASPVMKKVRPAG